MAAQQPPTPAATLPEASPPAREEVQRISSEQLLAGAQEVQIEHHGALYRLRQTSLGKLILTK
jgi:hemin uptake protein HemP